MCAGFGGVRMKSLALELHRAGSSIRDRQVGTNLAIALFGKPTLPFIVRQVVCEAGTGLVSQIARTPEPKRCGGFVVPSQQIAAVGAKNCPREIPRIRYLGQASARRGIPHRHTPHNNPNDNTATRTSNTY